MMIDKTSLGRVLLALAAMNLLGGCSGDDAAPGDGGGAGAQEKPLYVMMSQVYDTSDRTIFYPVMNTLDPTERVTLTGVHQEPGVANLQAADGKVLISGGLAPRVTSYIVDDDFKWTQSGTVNFASYGLTEDGANFYNQFVQSDEAITLTESGTFDRIVWNPSTMKVIGEYKDSTVPVAPSGMAWENGGNRADIGYPNGVRQVFNTGGELLLHEVSQLAVYSAETFAEDQVVELPCGGLGIATMDEDGNAYYSPYQDAGVPYLFGLGPKPCVARVDTNYGIETIDIHAITGFYGGNLRYLKDGYALAVVLRQDRFEGDYDYESGEFDEAIWDEVELASSWELWLLNLEDGSGEPVEGITQYYPQTEVIDGRAFVLVPDFEAATTTIYELVDGKLEKHIEAQGDVFKWVRVR